MQLCYSYSIMNRMDVCLINNHLLAFSFMSFIATLLGLLDWHSSTRKCWNILKTLPTIQALVWHLTKWNASENQNFTVTNASSILLCISYSAGNDDKGNANITNGLSCTWQAPNRTTAARTSFLCEVWETDWCTKVASSMQIVFYPSHGVKVFRPQFHQVSVGWMQDMRQRQ